jgi:hypothetical protein
VCAMLARTKSEPGASEPQGPIGDDNATNVRG